MQRERNAEGQRHRQFSLRVFSVSFLGYGLRGGGSKMQFIFINFQERRKETDIVKSQSVLDSIKIVLKSKSKKINFCECDVK